MEQTREGGLSGIAWLSIALAAIGAINWGLVGVFNFDLVAAIFGTHSTLSRIVYILVGLAGIYLLYLAAQLDRRSRLYEAQRRV